MGIRHVARGRSGKTLIGVAAAFVLASSLHALPAAQSAERPASTNVGVNGERLKRLGTTLAEYVTQGKLAGGVLLVTRHGKPLALEAFGERDREARSSMRPDTIFRIASQTKAIVSVGIMMLQEEGRLLITDPVARYLPEFRDTTVAVPKTAGGYDVVKARRPITIRDLLTHTSGIGYGTGTARDRWEAAGITGWYFADRDEPIAATVSRMPALPFDAHPGERWVYGYNIDILGVIIEKVSGQSLDDFLRARIFTPLGMSDTHFYLPETKRDRLAAVYALAGGRLQRAPDQGTPTPGVAGEPIARSMSQGAYVAGPRKSFSGGAGLLSTAPDYARFLQMLLNGGTLDGKRLLSRNTVELMTSNHLRNISYNDGQGFGLGFYIVTDAGARGIPGSVGEFGWGGAYHSTYWVDPKEQLVVVYLTQLIPAGDVDDHAKVRAVIYQALD